MSLRPLHQLYVKTVTNVCRFLFSIVWALIRFLRWLCAGLIIAPLTPLIEKQPIKKLDEWLEQRPITDVTDKVSKLAVVVFFAMWLSQCEERRRESRLHKLESIRAVEDTSSKNTARRDVFLDLLSSGVLLAEGKYQGINLRGANLTGIDLTKAILTGAELSLSDLSQSKLNGADLSNSYLFKTNLTGADLRFANLTDARLMGTDISGVDFGSATLIGAKWMRMAAPTGDLTTLQREMKNRGLTVESRVIENSEWRVIVRKGN